MFNEKSSHRLPETLAGATVQELHLELIRRSRHNAFDGARVLADLLAQREAWQTVLFDTYDLALSGRKSSLIKLRDLDKNIYNVDTLYMLAVDEPAARRLAAFAEPWLADEVQIYSQEETDNLLGGGDDGLRLVTMWWD
jgi:hypothetical protein